MIGGMLSISASIEALLFVSGEPFEKKRLATLLGLSGEEVQAALAELVNALQGRGIALIETELEVELRTSPEVAALVKKYRESELARDLGKASLETLAIIAYQKGATRTEVDWVRGVNSSASMRTLLLRGLVEGREDEKDKRRIRYSLTTEGMAHLGLSRPEDLPRYNELSGGTRDVVAHAPE
jgi:segregation and condensation protein B